jgi:hypothetical protein
MAMKLNKYIFLPVILATVLNGCQAYKGAVHLQAPAPLPSFHAGGEGMPMRRVAVLPLYCDQETAGSMRGMDMVFNEELAKTSLFEMVPVSREILAAHFGWQETSSVEILPADLLPRLAAEYGVDGVLFMDVTHYFPYQPVSIGVRAKLVDVKTGQIQWAFDHLFDSSQPAVSDAAQRYYVTHSNSNVAVPADGSSILQSPGRFSRYVAGEMFRSLKNVPSQAESAKVIVKPVD